MGEQDLTQAYAELGVRGPVFLHANLDVVRTGTWKAAAETLAASLNPYQLIVPTFTYSFCHGKPFDVKHSSAEGVGMFPEYYRHGVKRTPHGVFSVAGKNLPRIDGNAFGPNSIFSWLHGMDGTILFVGRVLNPAE